MLSLSQYVTELEAKVSSENAKKEDKNKEEKEEEEELVLLPIHSTMEKALKKRNILLFEVFDYFEFL